MSKIKRLLITGFLGFFVFTLLFSSAPKAYAAAGINQTINFQGKVAGSNGTNVANGNYDFIFRLYKASSGGVAQWTETWNSGSSQVAVTDGIFQVALGTHSSISALDFNDDSWYLTVEFNGDGEMDPRIRFTAVPYAFNAKEVAGLTVQDSAGGADTTGTLKVADGSTITFSADFTTSGDDAITFTTSASTNVTLPTTGTLATLAENETFTNKVIGSTGLTFSGASTDIITPNGQSFVVSAGDAISLTSTTNGITLQAAGSSTISTVQIGAGGVGSTTPDFLGLDVKSDTGDPAGGAEGYMYYNTADNVFRCYQNTGWVNCIGGAGSTTLQQAYDAGTPTILTDASGDVIIQLIGGATDTQFEINAASAPEIDMVNITNSGQGTVTDGVDGLAIDFTAATDAAVDTNAGLHITITDSGDAGDTISGLQVTAGTAAAGTQYGISIDTITGGAGAETALYIASGWDTGIDLNANTLVNIGNANTDFTSSGGLTLAGDLDANGNVSIADTDITLDGATTTFTSTGAVTFQMAGTGTTSVFQIGAGGGGGTTPDYFALDVKSTSGDPAAAGAEGYMYYNTADNKFRCYQATAWTDCIGAGGSTTLQQAYDNGTPTILTDASGDIIFQLIGGATDTQFEINAASAPEIDMINLTNAGFGVGTDGVDGLSINFVQSSGTNITNAAARITMIGSGETGDTISGLQIDATGVNNTTQYGINISSITGGSGTETALNIGSGWDTGINMNSNIITNIGDPNTAFGATGGLTLAGQLQVNDDLDINLDTGQNVTLLSTAAITADIFSLSSNGFSTTGTNVDGMQIVFAQGNDGDATDTNAGLHLVIDNSSGLADTLYAFQIDGITGGAATETAMYVGSGWDRGLTIADAGTYSVLLASDDGDVASGMTFGSTSPVSVFRSAANELTIGSTSNGFTFDIATATSASNPLYNGTMQPSKTIMLYPEFPGASLTTFYGAGTDSNTTVTVTSDTDSTANAFRNYYQISRTSSTLHYYTIAVKVKLPKDFYAWETSNAMVVNFATNSTSSANNLLDVYVYKDDATTSAVASSTSNVSGVAQTWTNVTIDDSTLDDGVAPEWDAADEAVIIFLRMGSQSSNWVRVGSITLNYKAAF